MDAPIASNVIGWDVTGTKLENKGTVPDISIVAQYINDIVNVSLNIDAVNDVADDMAAVLIAAANIADINAVGGSINNVNTVAGSLVPIGIVATNIASVNTVAPDIASVVAVGGSISAVVTVAPYVLDVETVADDIAAVVTASSNMGAIIAAPAAAALAQKWATEAEDVPVTTGPNLYSAFHWALKAAGIVLGGFAAAIHAATGKTTPVDADEFAIADSEASWSLKKLTLANLKNAFKVTPFVPIGGGLTVDPDMDTYLDGGFQGRVQFSTDSILHAPPEAGFYHVLVFYTNSTRLTQVLIPYSTLGAGQRHVWMRNIVSTSWGAWASIPWSDEVLKLVGGTLTGALTLPGNAVNALHAVPKQQLDAHPGVAKAKVIFDGTSTVSIKYSYNVSSVTDNGTGDYTINFATPLASANYAVAMASRITVASGGGGVCRIKEGVAPTASAFRMDTLNFNGALADPQLVTVAVF